MRISRHGGRGVLRQPVDTRQRLIHGVIRQFNASRPSELMDLTHCPLHQRASLRQTAQYSGGRLGHGAHAAEAGDEKDLFQTAA